MLYNAKNGTLRIGLAIPQYVIEILYILYLKKMVAIFSEGNDGLEIQ